MLETSVLGLGQDLGLITALGGAMTTSTYVYRIVFDLIPSRFNVRDMFSAYVTCMIAKDAVGQGLDNGKFWFGPLLEGVIDRGPKSARRD
ncbi:hypothetical protein DY000_02007292 [Brassica cretica]|uniref:Uncharacterized protein n=1 Tax=Brassica cretica TaxID=69181 RepID=A0ABQ7BVG6_BRACR|nr:hypothetical protein DY000_02007292 [Brassica cretica]